ncbi:hypothetical protein D9M70_482030 [compost metagenome]
MVGLNPAGSGIHTQEIRPVKTYVIFSLEHLPERITDIRRLNKRGGHLVNKGWKEIVIVPVYQHYLYALHSGQFFGQVHAGKSAADDHYFSAHMGFS